MLSEMITLFLIILYFIPGLLISSITEVSYAYFFSFLFFTFFFVFSDIWLGHPKKGIFFKGVNNSKVLKLLLFLCFIVTLYLSFVFKQSFSFSRLIIVLTDVYETRASAISVHWLIITLEQWAVYFSAFMITYSLLKKKYLLSLFLIFCELFFFILQGNRIGLFVTIIAVILGCFKNISSRVISLGVLSMIIVILIECVIFDHGGIITNIFRRFTIVPNRLGYNYYDFFQSNPPDYLRSAFTRIFEKLLGLPSPYQNITHMIGETYYHAEMGANTGMMGSAMLSFGNAGLISEPLFIILFTRILDKCTIHIKNRSLLYSIAVVFVSLLINTPYALANCFSLSYYLLLVISLLFVEIDSPFRRRISKNN